MAAPNSPWPSPTPLGVFEQLPLEIRQQIWSYTLPGSDTKEIIYREYRPFCACDESECGCDACWRDHSKCWCDKEDHYTFTAKFRQQTEWSRTSNSLHWNRAIYQEASAILYDLGTVGLSVSPAESERTFEVRHPTLGRHILHDVNSALERPQDSEKTLSAVPWHRFRDVQIRLEAPQDMQEALDLRYDLRSAASLLRRCIPKGSAPKDVKVLLSSPRKVIGDAWRVLPAPITTEKRVTARCTDLYRQPIYTALVAMAELLDNPRANFFIESDDISSEAVADSLHLLAQFHVLDYVHAGVRRFQVHCTGVADGFRAFARDIRATQEHLLDYMCGTLMINLRNQRRQMWLPDYVNQELADIIGHERAGEFMYGLQRRHGIHLLTTKYDDIYAVRSEEWNSSRRYRGRLLCKESYVRNGSLETRSGLLDCAEHEFYKPRWQNWRKHLAQQARRRDAYVGRRNLCQSYMPKIMVI